MLQNSFYNSDPVGTVWTILRSRLLQCCLLVSILVGSMYLAGNVGFVGAQEAKSKQPAEKEEKKKPDEADGAVEKPVIEEQPFEPDFEDDDLAETRNRAWEYRPYHVAVWFCLDGSPVLNSVYKKVAFEVTERSELLDPSGWDLTTGLAPSKWRYRFLNFLDDGEKCADVAGSKSLEEYDKLMIVCMSSESGVTSVRVRELDLQTQQWGPVVVRKSVQHSNLDQSVMNAIKNAFMPIAKIERVQELLYTDEKGKSRARDEVVMQMRGVKSCVRTERVALEVGEQDPPVSDLFENEASESSQDPETAEAQPEQPEPELFKWVAEPIKGSPVYIKDDDRLLPVIRKTDRKGNLVKLEPIEFTFLTVNAQEDAVLRASIESYHRAPLAQRKSKRAQKLALVIRAPEQSTRLYLFNPVRGKTRGTPLEGFEIWSRRPGASIDEKSEFLGKTNWRGAFIVPPSDEGLRIIYVKRGSRALRRLPIIPGLYQSVSTNLPNDETRLFAEGVIQGLSNEVLSIVIQREVFEKEIDAAIKAKDLELAKSTFKKLQDLESPTEFKNRMSEDESFLKTQTTDMAELGFINRMFDSLRKQLNEQEKKSRENEFTETLLNLR